MSPLEEQDMLDRCRKGDASAWDQFFDVHYAMTGRFVFQLIPDATPEDVEEVCQDAFLAAIRSMESFEGRSRVQTWLCRIAANKARDFRDRRLAGKRGGGRVPVSLHAEDPATGRVPDAPSEGKTPDEAIAIAESMAEVRRAMDQLGDPCREVLELRYFADLDYNEMGALLGLNLKTVSSRLSRCLDKLGEALLLASQTPPEPVRRNAV